MTNTPTPRSNAISPVVFMGSGGPNLTAPEQELIDYLDQEAEIEISSAGKMTELGKALRNMEATARRIVRQLSDERASRQKAEAKRSGAERVCDILDNKRAAAEAERDAALEVIDILIDPEAGEIDRQNAVRDARKIRAARQKGGEG